MNTLNKITRRDVLAYLAGAASATVALAIIVSLTLSMFGYSVVTHYAPQPTFIPQPTFAVQPPFAEQPTFIPQPTFTFTPTSTPTNTPTNTPTITPTTTATMTRTPGAGTGTATANNRTPSSTPTEIAVNTQTITCTDKDQSVTYTVTGPVRDLSCVPGLTSQSPSVKTLKVYVANGDIQVTLDRVGGIDAMYATIITYISSNFGTVQYDLSGASMLEGHATITSTNETLYRVVDSSPVSMEMAIGEDFTVSATATLDN